MGEPEKRRLFIGGLHEALTEQELRERFDRHGTISSIEIKRKNDSKGIPVKTFAYMDIILTDNDFKKCMTTYNNAKWKGNIMQIQPAKESFLTKLERERSGEATCSEIEPVVKPKRPSHQALAVKRLAENFQKAGVNDFTVKGKVPGSDIEGEKNWVVGKYGRVLPVVYIRRKDKQKIVCCDPSKFSHHVKRFKDDDKESSRAGDAVGAGNLTWELPEITSEKRKGIFPQGRPLPMHRKRIKDDLAVKREQLLAGIQTKKRVTPRRRYNSNSSDDYSDGDDDDDEEEEDDNQNVNVDDDRDMSADFEIVPGNAAWKKNSSAEFHQRTSAPLSKRTDVREEVEGDEVYDSDRDSVDTDEICTSLRTSANITDSQPGGGGLKRKAEREEEFHLGDHQVIAAKRKQGLKPDEIPMRTELGNEEDSEEVEDEDRLDDHDDDDDDEDDDDIESSDDNDDVDNDEDDDGDDVSDVDGDDDDKEGDDSEGIHEGDDIDQDDSAMRGHACDSGNQMASLTFEPLILDRTVLMRNQTQPGEQGEANTQNSKSLCSEAKQDKDDDDDDDDDDEGDVREISSPVANLNFEPLILDRAAIAEWNPTPESSNAGSEVIVGSKIDDEDEDASSSNGHSSSESELEETMSSDDKDTDEEEDGDETEMVAEEENDEIVDNQDSDSQGVDKDQDDHSSSSHTSKSDDETPSLALSTVPTSANPQSAERTNTEKLDQVNEIEDREAMKLKKKLKMAAKKLLAKEKAEKQRLANERRLDSMRQQQRALIDRQSAIKGALAAVDSAEKKQGKHTTFSSDDEDEDDDDDGGLGQSTPVSIPLAVGIPASTPANQLKKPGQVTLFGSDDDDADDDDDSINDGGIFGDKRKGDDADDSDDDDDDDDDEERFRIKPQYEGEAGQKLLRLEGRFGGDSRFKMDARFLNKDDDDDDEGKHANIDQDPLDETSVDLQEEKQRSLSILQSMMGTPMVTLPKRKEPQFRDPSQLQYDPSKGDHSKYELTDKEEESDGKKLEKEMRKEKRKMETERAKVPEVSKETFFQVSSNLKEAFSGGRQEEKEEEEGGGGGGGSAFTFFGGDESEGEEAQLDKEEESATYDLASSLFPSKRFKYDSSDSEDDEREEKMEQPQEQESQTMDVEEEKDTSTPQTFFFQSDDPRLKEGALTFCRPKDHDAMLSTWEELKAQLQNDFRKRHQKAVRDQKTSKKWLKKPSKTQTQKRPSKR